MGSSVTANVETVGDQDWFAMGLIAGRTYRIAATGAFQTSGQLTLGYGKLYGIYDAAGAAVSGPVDMEREMQWEFRPANSGEYFVSMGGEDLWILAGNQDDYHSNLSPTPRY